MSSRAVPPESPAPPELLAGTSRKRRAGAPRSPGWGWLGAGALGVVGAVLVLVGGSWYQALATPPYRYIDEQAHVGYVLELQRGRLPTIDTPIDGAHGGEALRQRLATEPARRRDVWVANNPPLAYLLALPLATTTRALGVPGGVLLGLRLANVAATAAAVALAYRLGRDLAGGDRTVGLTTAGLVALLPHVGFVAALAFNDGVALLATTGTLWSLTRVLLPPTPLERGAPERRSRFVPGRSPGDELPSRLLILGLWCAAAAATRPMALGFAAVAAGLALVGTWGRVSLPRAAAWLAGPTAVLAGWWYVGNVVRYGDATGSQALFDKFLREPAGTLVSNLRDNTIWESAFRTITTRRTDAPLPTDPVVWFRVAEAIALVGVVGAVVLVVASHRRDAATDTDTDTGAAGAVEAAGAVDPSRHPQLPARAWAAVTVVSLVPVVLTAQHAAGGGNPHPRYLLPALPVLAAALALTTVRLATRWGAVALLGSVAVLTAVQTRASVRDLAAHPAGAPGTDLVAPIGATWVRGAGAAVAVAGLVLLLVAISWRAEPGGEAGRRSPRARPPG